MMKMKTKDVPMKTSVVEVHDMLSVFSVEEVEKRIGEVPGVDSVTVDFAGGSATVRYDETRLEVADIKSTVRQRGYASDGDGHKGKAAAGAPPATPAPKTPATAAPKTPSVGPEKAVAASSDTAQEHKSQPDASPPTTEVGSKKSK